MLSCVYFIFYSRGGYHKSSNGERQTPNRSRSYGGHDHHYNNLDNIPPRHRDAARARGKRLPPQNSHNHLQQASGSSHQNANVPPRRQNSSTSSSGGYNSSSSSRNGPVQSSNSSHASSHLQQQRNGAHSEQRSDKGVYAKGAEFGSIRQPQGSSDSAPVNHQIASQHSNNRTHGAHHRNSVSVCYCCKVCLCNLSVQPVCGQVL